MLKLNHKKLSVEDFRIDMNHTTTTRHNRVVWLDKHHTLTIPVIALFS